MRSAATVVVWCAALLALAVAASIATAMVFMAASLDPTDMVTTGIDAWTDALKAGGAFAGLVVVVVVALRLWHTARFKTLGALLTLAAVASVAWACTVFVREYF